MAKGPPSFHVAFGAPASPEAEIRPDDWLNVRRSTGAEQRLAGLKSWHNATTYHFRACDIALPLVIGQRIRQPAGSARVSMGIALRELIERKGDDVEDAFSTHLFGIVMLLAPEAIAELHRVL